MIRKHPYERLLTIFIQSKFNVGSGLIGELEEVDALLFKKPEKVIIPHHRYTTLVKQESENCGLADRVVFIVKSNPK